MNTLVAAWVALSGGGLIMSTYLVWQSWQDIIALGDRGNGRRWAARSRFVREGFRVTVHWVWLMLGVWALLDIRLGALLIFGLLYGNAVLVMNSLIDARTRSLIYRTRLNEPEIPHA